MNLEADVARLIATRCSYLCEYLLNTTIRS